MSDNTRVLYVNDDMLCVNDDNTLIYGAAIKNTHPTPEVVVKKDQEVVDPVDPKVDPVDPKVDPVDPVDPKVDNNNDDQMIGGYDDDASSKSSDDVSSLSTTDLLRVDPLYYRLTKFLQTGGDDGSDPQNVAEILKKINMQLENITLLMTKYISQNEKQCNID